MPTWQDLTDALAKREAPSRFWWRDDDAHRAHNQLDRLLQLSADHGAPATLAVVPAWLEPSLRETLAPHGRRIQCALHGYAHRNHADPNQKKCEYPWERASKDITDELTLGASILREQLPDHWVPAFVPPWNRFDPVHYPALQSAYFRCFSAYKNPPVPGMHNQPIHLDIIDWRHRAFRGTEACLEMLIESIGTAEDTPIGIMSHHLDHDAGCWEFLDRLLRVLSDSDDAHIGEINVRNNQDPHGIR